MRVSYPIHKALLGPTGHLQVTVNDAKAQGASKFGGLDHWLNDFPFPPVRDYLQVTAVKKPTRPRGTPDYYHSQPSLKSNSQHLRPNRKLTLLLLYRAPHITRTSNPASTRSLRFWIHQYFRFEGLLPKKRIIIMITGIVSRFSRSNLVSGRTPQYLPVRSLWWVIPRKSKFNIIFLWMKIYRWTSTCVWSIWSRQPTPPAAIVSKESRIQHILCRYPNSLLSIYQP